MVKPRSIKSGDVVGVIAPSDAVERVDVEKGRKILESWGLKVKIGKHVYAKVGDFAAGTAAERMEDIMTMINDDDVKVIWAAGGGYAATEILPVFSREVIEKLSKAPKIFVGYSDVCLILNALASFRMVSILGPNLAGLSEWDKKTQNEIRKLLFGEKIEGYPGDTKWKSKTQGAAEGRLLVSNLETLILSFGTRFDPLMYGSGSIILGLEELDIDKSALQRQIDTVLNHKRAGRISGIFIGRLVNIAEKSYPEWGQKVTAEGLIADRIVKWGGGKCPVAFCADFGHPEWAYGAFAGLRYYFSNRRFYPLPEGISARLTVEEKSAKLEYLENLTQE
jgi:muramoyltetrapeptide carboxypeptidase